MFRSVAAQDDTAPGSLPLRSKREQAVTNKPKNSSYEENVKALAIPAGLEPATRGVEIRYSIQLSYGTVWCRS